MSVLTVNGSAAPPVPRPPSTPIHSGDPAKTNHSKTQTTENNRLTKESTNLKRSEVFRGKERSYFQIGYRVEIQQAVVFKRCFYMRAHVNVNYRAQGHVAKLKLFPDLFLLKGNKASKIHQILKKKTCDRLTYYSP